MAEEIDFEEQLEQEKRQQAEEEEKEAATIGLSYTDSDGTIMEWDPIKRAFFPKVLKNILGFFLLFFSSFILIMYLKRLSMTA